MNCVRFAYTTNKTAGSNIFNSDNSNIVNIKKQPCQIIKLHITYEILKFKPIIKTISNSSKLYTFYCYCLLQSQLFKYTCTQYFISRKFNKSVETIVKDSYPNSSSETFKPRK